MSQKNFQLIVSGPPSIPSGYKRTDGGIVPEDWTERTVGQLLEFKGGSQPDKSVFSSAPRIGYVRLIQIRDYKTDKYEVYVPRLLVRRFCDENDIMIGRYGPPIFQILRGLTGAYNVALIKVNPLAEIDREFAYYFLKQDSLFDFIEKLSRRSSGQTGVDLGELRAYPLALPSLPEQRAIASALSDVDALLGALDRLIAKKRDLKQAAMQKLLTGQTRLPGFKGEWVVKTIREIARCFSGGTPATGIHAYYDGSIPWITSGDLNKGYITDVGGRISQAGLDNSAAKMVEPETLLMALYGATAGVVGMSMINAAINQAVLAIVPHYDNSSFIYFKLRSLKEWLIKTFTQGGQPNLSGEIVKSIEIPMPSVSEQTAIAEVLSDMDAEIAALEQRREKTRALKQGMMQELLTGRTRLL